MNPPNYIILCLLSIANIITFVLYLIFTKTEKVNYPKITILSKNLLYLLFNLTLMCYDEPTPLFKLLSSVFGDKSTIGFFVFLYFMYELYILYILYAEFFFCITYVDHLNPEKDQVKFYWYIPPLVIFFIAILVNYDLFDLISYMLIVSLFVGPIYTIVNICLIDKTIFIKLGKSKLILIVLWIGYALFVIGDWACAFLYVYNYNRGSVGVLLPKLHFLFYVLGFGLQIFLVIYSKPIIIQQNEDELVENIVPINSDSQSVELHEL